MQESDWDVTFLFQEKGKANDLGGNSLAVTKDAKDPETAADFIKFVANESNMEYYAIQAQTIPTRKALQSKTLDYPLRPDAMNKVFVPSAATVPPSLAAAETVPAFGTIRSILDDQLDLAFTSGQSAAATAQNIATQVGEAIKS
jgi:multiple sugar transport system substrate-binding protein